MLFIVHEYSNFISRKYINQILTNSKFHLWAKYVKIYCSVTEIHALLKCELCFMRSTNKCMNDHSYLIFLRFVSRVEEIYVQIKYTQRVLRGLSNSAYISDPAYTRYCVWEFFSLPLFRFSFSLISRKAQKFTFPSNDPSMYT